MTCEMGTAGKQRKGSGQVVPAESRSPVPAPFAGPKRTVKQRREVYFVRATRLRLIKIGVANNAMDRVDSMRAGSPDVLELIGVVICDRFGALELDLHKRFAADREHSEWFRETPELMDYITQHATREGSRRRLSMLERNLRAKHRREMRWAKDGLPKRVAELQRLETSPPRPTVEGMGG